MDKVMITLIIIVGGVFLVGMLRTDEQANAMLLGELAVGVIVVPIILGYFLMKSRQPQGGGRGYDYYEEPERPRRRLAQPHSTRMMPPPRSRGIVRYDYEGPEPQYYDDWVYYRGEWIPIDEFEEMFYDGGYDNPYVIGG